MFLEPDALNKKVVAAVDNPPAAVNKSTFLTTTPSSFATAIFAVPAFEFSGKVTPAAEIEIEPVPSELRVAPPRLIV